MGKHEVEIFEDISKSLHRMVLALTYSYENPNEVMSIAESLTLIEKKLSNLNDIMDGVVCELEDIKERMLRDESERKKQALS